MMFRVYVFFLFVFCTQLLYIRINDFMVNNVEILYLSGVVKFESHLSLTGPAFKVLVEYGS